ncbi:TPA: dynamin family protein [Haemophilus influenzae]|uniref:dynamin family protein n=1 Tax=Haemophilus influenzae TaxID=727 RepID=UPI001CC77BFB|nr:dynamin family protein [Haemophilus influenzae]MBZ5690402.1 dynamin family protein [Haemophilus influenzae]
MTIKENLLNYIQQAKEIIEPLSLNNETKEEEIAVLDKYSDDINHLEMIIPIVGGFSAGKSTLINYFLDPNHKKEKRKGILPTGQEPVTKLPTELRYTAGREYAELIKLDDNNPDFIIERTQVNLSELDKFVAESGNQNDELDYSYIKLYSNNKKLKELEPFILADMPGFGSANNRHNKAIDLYIRRGVHFVILHPVGSGEITGDIIQEAEKILQTEKEFTFCLTKVDTRSEDIIEEVRENITDTLNDLDYENEIYVSSVKNTNALQHILDNIDKDKLIENIFSDGLHSQGRKFIETLNSNISVLQETEEEIKSAKDKLERQKERLEEKQAREMHSLESRRFDGVNLIIERIKTELRTNKSRLLRTLERNQSQFSEEVGGLIQNTLSSSVKSYLERLSTELTEQFAGILQEMSARNASQMSLNNESLSRLKADINRKMNQTLLDIRNIDTNVKEDSQSNNDVIGIILKIITSLLTKNPIAQAVVSLLPSFITDIFGGSDDGSARRIQEMKQQDALERAFEESIIPKVASSIEEQLPQMLNGFKNQLIAQIKIIFDQEIKDKIQEIDRASQEKGNVKDQELEISKLKSAISSLKQAMKNYL